MPTDLHSCELCPRRCGADRYASRGFCGVGAKITAARAMLHHWEEPCISGSRGSGAIFFSGCPLRCVFCQNHALSHEGYGAEISADRLADIMLALQEKGAHNINLVSPTQYVPEILRALDRAKPRLTVPVVYNTGGYERVETVAALSGYVDVYLDDIKYFSPALSQAYAAAPDYFARASEALSAMAEQVGACRFDGDGIMTGGVIVRHLILPGCRTDSMEILRALPSYVNVEDIKLSLMSQYTPDFAPDSFKNLKRRLTTFEYQSVLAEAEKLGYDGYRQEFSSSDKKYTPDFRLQGIVEKTEDL